MLNSLYIRNYAIIRELEIGFQEGFSTITGETGAGKSILLGALSLILGRRADLSVLQNKEEKCIIEGSFSQLKNSVILILKENEIEISEPLIIRREISPNGKSRAFVNDSPVQLPVLQSIGDLLVDIHSQHENLNLGDNLYQLAVLDAYAGNDDILNKYREEYTLYTEFTREYNLQLTRKEENQKELDFLSFQYEELEKAKLSEGEMKSLEAELDILQHAEEIKHALLLCASAYMEEENGLNARLKRVESALQKVAGYHKIASDLRERITSCLIELKDIAMEAEQAGEITEHDPLRQTWLEERLGLIFRLMKKHGQESESDLIRYAHELKLRIGELGSYELRLEELEKKRREISDKIRNTGKLLSEIRNNSRIPLETRITTLLLQLGIPNAVFKIKHEKAEIPGPWGFDRISFLFTANKKSELQDISKIASGGELSRLMLCIKYIISHSLGLPTIIFDEIDTGVSGEIAHKVSLMMREMADNHQVLTITHLPQVAARGNRHYLVYKTDENSHTETKLRLLSTEERLAEIARMLSGAETTPAATENARELLGM